MLSGTDVEPVEVLPLAGRGCHAIGGQQMKRSAVLLCALWMVTSCGADGSEEASTGHEQVVTIYQIKLPSEAAHLVPVQVEVPGTGDVGVDAVTALIYTRAAGPDHYNAWSTMALDANDTADAGAKVLSVTQADGVVTVDLDSHAPEGVPVIDCARASDTCAALSSGKLMLQQLVFTAQAALDSTDPVVLTDQGEPATMVSGTNIDGPVHADPNVLAAVH
jgi:Sporulation and spore germination